MTSLNGIIPPLPTPYDAKGEIYIEKLKDNLKYLKSFDLKGFLLLGSNGELVMLSEKERMIVLENARLEIPEDKIMIAGTGCQSTKHTIESSKSAAALGADIALVLNPSYYKTQMNADALVNHYKKVADASPIPILIYNMPANSGMDMDAETIFSISEHPNIIGLKDSGGNVTKIGSLVAMCDHQFLILAGGAGYFLPALSVGAVGGILALANILPQYCIDLYHHFIQGKMEDARELQTKIIDLNTAITRKWGIPALKATMDMVGLYGGPVREPLRPTDNDKNKILKMLLTDLGVLE